MKNNKKRQDPWNKTDLHQNKKKSRPTDPTRKTRVGWRQTNNFLSPALLIFSEN